MQTSILRSLALVLVGNAALGGRDVSAFWPRAELFRYYKQVEFLVAHGEGEYARVAEDPLSWLDKLKALRCQGLRLHNAPMRQREGIGPQPERMLVGMVGGGPRWLIEAVYPTRAEVWEGHDRLGDRAVPDRRIWLSAYVMIGETEPQAESERDVAVAASDVRAALLEIEAFARTIPGAPFADDFAAALGVLDGAPPTYPGLDFLELTELDECERRLLAASAQAWVFGAMGSWNDIGVEDALKPAYDATSEALFMALQRAVMALANSTYRG